MMDKAALKKLAASIKINGQQEEITTIEVDGEDQVLDGRNRFAACRLAGVEPEFKEYTGDDPLGFVIEKNMERRHLTPGELAKIAAKIATMTKGHRTDLPPSGGKSSISQADAAAMVGASVRSVQRAVSKTKPKSKAKAKDASSWSQEDLKADGELMNAFVSISAIFGNEDTKAIRTGQVGLKRADVLQLAKLPSEKMRECQDLIMANHWTPAKALKFLSKMPDDYTTIAELKNYCLATKGNFFTGEFGGFTVTCKATRAASRK